MKKLLIILALLFVAGSAYAQTQGTNPCAQGAPSKNLTYCPLEPLPGVSPAWYAQGNIGGLFNTLFKLLITLGALFAVVTLVWGGVAYMTSEATGTKDTAKKRMTAAIYGLLLLAGSYLILGTINPDLLKITVTPGAITSQRVSAPEALRADNTHATAEDIRDCEERGLRLKRTSDGLRCM